MRSRHIASLAIIFSCIASSVDAELRALPESLHIQPGEYTPVKWPGLEHAIEIYVPPEYSADRSWPMIMNYHGTHEMPHADVCRHLLGGKHFVLIGMEYNHRGPGIFSPEEGKKMVQNGLRTYRAVRKWISSQLNIDQKRVYVSGLSKGGWHTSNLGDKDMVNIAGLIITMAGRHWSQTRAINESAFREKPIYIGVGEHDPNCPHAHYAKEYYRRCGARVSFEEFPGIGHQLTTRSGLLKDWLEVEGALKSIPEQERAAQLSMWLKDKLDAITEAQVANDQLKQYYLLQLLRNNPKMHMCSPAELKKVSVIWDKLLSDSKEVSAEFKAQQMFTKNLQKEVLWLDSSSRSLANLKKVHKAYHNTAHAHPETRYVLLAEGSRKRVAKTIASAEQSIQEAREEAKRRREESRSRMMPPTIRYK
ncbi:hypothetical protein BVX97_03215 [bacterium E08(2017)]|nr:hypothetical protein BVX97_03215 [bacterium E08(2017)]